MKRPEFVALGAEALGTFMLVFGGCGTAVIAGSAPAGGVGSLGVALAFGLALLAAVYALGPISGAHFNPAVSIGLATAGRFPWRHVPGYIGAQVIGSIIAAVDSSMAICPGSRDSRPTAMGRTRREAIRSAAAFWAKWCSRSSS
jgi:glycerol uptake facilitator-like aquaporin